MEDNNELKFKAINDNGSADLEKTNSGQPRSNNSFLFSLVIAFMILFTYKHFVEKPKREAAMQAQQKVIEQTKEEDIKLYKDSDSVFYNPAEKGDFVQLNTDKIQGKIYLKGAKFNNLSLKSYFDTIDKNQNVVLLKEGEDPYFIDYNWKSNDKSIKVPDLNSIWKTDNKTLTINKSINLSWDNGEGLIFNKTISIDEDYMFTIDQWVQNDTNKSISLIPYTKMVKEDKKVDAKKQARQRAIQKGPVGSINNILEEHSYKKLKKEKEASFTSTDGWFGFSDKYWMTASVFNKESSIDIKYTPVNSHDVYEINVEARPLLIPSLQKKSYVSKLFTGAKELTILDDYMLRYNISNFDKAIDFGWYYFLTKPFYYLLNLLGHLTGNFGLAILIFTILLRIALYPMANKSYKSSLQMKKIQPKIKELKERYGSDKQKMQMKLMELYKKEKISPAGGCLPLLIQIPVFFSLYKVLSISIEMRHAPFFGWIQDLSAPDATNIFTGFGLIDWNPPALLMVGIWPLLMGLTMFLQQRMNPKPDDKAQARAFMLMPIVFTFMLARFASGLVIYWTFSNTFAVFQQWHLKRTLGGHKF